jgi:hypothetical protein
VAAPDIKVEEVQHSKLGASGAYRWMNCAGSVQLIEKLGSKARGAGEPAAEGTAAHQIAAMCLVDGTDAWEHMGKRIEVSRWTFEVDQGMVDSVQTYLNFVRYKLELHKGKGGVLLVEKSMSSMLDDEAYGTLDVGIYVPGDRIIVMDFKHGAGVCVEPGGAQDKEYGYFAVENAAEFVDDTDFKVVELFIVQPRHPHPKGPIRQYVASPDELITWFTGELIPAMAETRRLDANLTIGDHCRFCPAKEFCPALNREVRELNTSVEPVSLTGEQLGELLGKKKAIIKFFEELEFEGFKRIRKGEKVTGQKLVRKQANRAFKDVMTLPDPKGDDPIILKFEDEVKKAFGDDAYQEPKLKTPPNIDKLGPEGKKFVAQWAFVPDTGFTMAPENDKREEVQLTGEEFFGEQD